MSRRWSRRPGTRGRRGGRFSRALGVVGVVATVLLVGAAGSAAGLAGTPSSVSREAAAAPTVDVRSATGPGAAAPRVTPAKDKAVVVLESLSPTIARAGTDVTLTGTVTAPLDGPLTGPTVRVVRGDVSIAQHQALDDWAAGRTPATGPIVAEDTRLADVPAGRSRAFTLTIPWRALYTRDAFAALPISVEVLGSGAKDPAGSTRTFIAWNNRKEYIPLKIATVLPVTLDPEADLFASDDAKRLAAWQRTIGPDSRVSRLVEGTAGADVTLAVDPSVLGPEATAPLDGTGTAPTPTAAPTGTATPVPTVPTGPTGSATSPTPTPTAATPTADAATQPTPALTTTGAPTVPSPTGTPTPGPTATSDAPVNDQIARLGGDLLDALRGRTLWTLPYTDADIAATVGVDPTNSLIRDLVDRGHSLADRVGQPVRSDIVWPVDGLLPAGREAGITKLLSGTTVRKPAGIVVNENAITADSPYTPTARRVASGGTRLLGYDPRLSAMLPKASDASPVAPTQRFLAETLVLLNERPGTARSVLVTAPRTFDPEPEVLAGFFDAVQSAPWLTTVSAASLLTDSGNDTALAQQKPSRPVASAAPAPVLNARRLDQMAVQTDDLRSVAAVLRDGEQFEQTYREVLDELASVRWRYDPKSWTVLSTMVEADVRAATRAIRVVPRTVNFLAETGTLQVTIDNGLDYEVEDIRLRLAPTNPRIQIVEQPGPITIGPSSRTNVPVEVAAVAAGKAEIRAYLTTSDGTAIGSPAIIPVTANPIDGAIYWVGGILVGLVLVFGVGRAVLKGTSRADEIPDIEAVTAAHENVEDEDRD